MNSRRPFHPIRAYRIALAALLAFSASAAAQTWTAGVNTNWNTAGNWTPATVPNSATADVILGPTGAGLVNISASVQAQSLTFDSVAGGAYTLTSSANQTLSGVSAINLTGPIVNVQTINLANVAAGSLLVPGTASLALVISNGAAPTAATSPTLVIGPNTVIGRSGLGSPGMTVTGTGTTEISGTIASTMTGGLVMRGPGRLVISGTNNGAGSTIFDGGSLLLDYTTAVTSKLPAGGMILGGGDLTLQSHPTTTFVESVVSTSITAGHTDVRADTNNGALAGLTFNLGAITRSAGSTASFFAESGGAITTTTGLINGILGGWATDSVDWATKSGSNIVPLSTYGTNVYAAGTNTDVTIGTGIPGGFTTNSLRFNTAVPGGLTAFLSGINTLQSGGILMGSGTEDVTITGGNLIANGELIVHLLNTNDLTIVSSLTVTSAGGLTKTGAGQLTLAGGTSGVDGPVNVNRGSIRFTATGALSPLTAINFNDDRTVNTQALRVEFGDGINAITGTAIRLAPGTSGVVFDNSSLNSRVTFNGVISSPAGAQTALQLNSASSSGFDLTGTNTFTGDISLIEGFLGIDANGSLGNVANTLTLAVNSSIAGGLEFLNGGIDVARPVHVDLASRVLSTGVDVNTISGVISGTGPLVKDGTGTLVLTGANTWTGPLGVDAGTLRVASAANLGAGTGNFTLGGTLSVTENLTISRPFVLGPVGGGTGPGTIDVAALKTLTLSGPLNNRVDASGSLVKTGLGTLALTFASGSTYLGGTTVQEGTLQAANNFSLGAAAGRVTVEPPGTLSFTGTTTTARTFNLTAGSLTIAAGRTLTFSGATVGGGFLRGAGGGFVVTNGATLTGVTLAPSAVVTVSGAGSLLNFTNGGAVGVTVGGNLATFDLFTNQGSGTVEVAGSSRVNVSDFQTSGLMTLHPGSTGSPTQVTNTGASPLFFNGGSRTFIGTPATAPQFAAGIDLGGQTLELNGGLLVNNGTVNGTVNVNFGSVAKGAGQYGVVNVRDGGVYAPGNSPGISTAAAVDFDDTPTIFGGPTLMIELAGIAPGTEYDQLHVTGSLKRGGTLAVSLVNGFTPEAGNSFDILDWGTTTGAFGTVNLPALTGTLTWDTSRLPTTGELIVIPEPGSAVLLALGALAFAARRRAAIETAG